MEQERYELISLEPNTTRPNMRAIPEGKITRSSFIFKFVDKVKSSTNTLQLSPLARWLQKASWNVETLSIFFALSSFSVLVVILNHYNGIPSAAWPFGALTLNGLVAILATITRVAQSVIISASLSQYKWIWYTRKQRELRDLDAFDQASKSVWGSLVLLWRLKGLHLASLSALLTILGLAFDVFSQQVISIESHSVVVDVESEADLPLVQRGEVYLGRGNEGITYYTDPGLPMIAALSAGLLSFNATEPNPVCITGNCTWPVFSSLAVCGGCANITSALNYTTSSLHEGYWNFTLPDGFKLINNDPTSTALLNTSMVEQTSSYQHFKSIIDNPEDGYLMFAHFETIIMNEYSGVGTAHECALWFCVQAYNVSMVNGLLHKSTLTSWTKIDPQWQQQSENDAIHFNFTVPPAEYNIPAGTTFVVGKDVSDRLQLSASDVIPGHIIREDAYMMIYSGGVRGIYANVDHLDAWIDNYAAITSQALKLSSATSPVTDTYYIGTVFRDEIHTKVRWAWLAFPALTLLGSCLVLLVMIWRTGLSLVGAWKSSALALLFTGIDDDVASAAQGAMDRDSEYLVEKVGKEKVQLFQVEGKWKFG